MKTKFRAFYPETKQMIYGNANRAVIDFEGKVLVMDNISGNYVVPKDFVLMQSTGLHDKNGKEIYEGDIVKLKLTNEFNSTEIRIGECFWNDKTAQWTFKFESNWEYPACDWVAIIGNIYENPELLESNEVK